MEKVLPLNDVAPITPGNSGGLVCVRDPDGSVYIPGISSWAPPLKGVSTVPAEDVRKILEELGIDA